MAGHIINAGSRRNPVLPRGVDRSRYRIERLTILHAEDHEQAVRVLVVRRRDIRVRFGWQIPQLPTSTSNRLLSMTDGSGVGLVGFACAHACLDTDDFAPANFTNLYRLHADGGCGGGRTSRF